MRRAYRPALPPDGRPLFPAAGAVAPPPLSTKELIALALAWALLASACAPYRFGARSLYPPDIRTVYVPIFESDSFRRNLGERLTEAVVKEIELKTPYKVVGTPLADSVLSGRITSDTKGVTVIAPTDEARQLELNLVVQVTWIDRKGDLIRQAQEIALPASLAEVNQTITFVPEAGQSITTAQQDAIQRLARQIVALMEAPW